MKITAKGFTLIELLIVIAVLGILAVAVLSAINPIEQINRSKDTGGRSDSEQLIGAIDRFYASQGYYPWKSDPNTPASDVVLWSKVVDNAAVGPAGWGDGTTSVLSKLQTGGSQELKESFVTRITDAKYNSMYVYNHGGPGETTYVCFQPKSGSFQLEAWTRCGLGVTGTNLPPDLKVIAGTVCLTATTSFSCLP